MTTAWKDDGHGRDGHEADPLDAVLRDAAWLEIESNRVERLREQWTMISQHRRRRLRLCTMAAAACIVVSTAGTCWFVGRHWDAVSSAPNRDLVVAEQIDREQKRATHEVSESGPDRQADAERQGRAVYEQLIAVAFERRFATAGAEPEAGGRSDEVLEQAVSDLASRDDANVAEVAEPLLDRREHFEGRLVEIVRHSKGQQRTAAARLLAELATRHSVPMLIQLRQLPSVRADATAALARLADPLTLARLARTEGNPALQRRLLAPILDRGSIEEVELFLNLAQHRTTAGAALESVQDVSSPPVEFLFEFLRAPRVSLRLAAARVLGRLNDPNVSQRLVQLVFSSEAGHEALVALLASDETLAKQFVQRAQLDWSLAASVRAAHHRLQSIHN